MVLAQSHPVEVVKATADKGVNLVPQPDGSVRAQGKNPNDVTYEVIVKTNLPKVTGLKLECLSDAPLPAKGPGRRKDGAFIVTQLQAFTSDSADFKNQKPLALNDLIASSEAKGWTAKMAMDGKRQKGWSTAGQPGKDQWLAATFKEPVNAAGAKDAWLKLVIKHLPKDNSSIGCLRVRLITGREVSQEFAALPAFPIPPNPLASLPKRISLPALGKGAAAAGATDPMEIGELKSTGDGNLNLGLLGVEGATSGRDKFSIESGPAGANPRWLVGIGQGGSGTTIAQFTVKDGKLWFQWAPAAVESKPAEYLGNCVLDLTSGEHEHRIVLRKPVEANAIALFSARRQNGSKLPNRGFAEVRANSLGVCRSQEVATRLYRRAEGSVHPEAASQSRCWCSCRRDDSASTDTVEQEHSNRAVFQSDGRPEASAFDTGEHQARGRVTREPHSQCRANESAARSDQRS